MVDNDGKFSYSKVAYITIDATNVHISIHPNPAHGYFIISNYDNADIKNMSIQVRDITGKTLISQKFNNSIEQKINITNLSKGMYIVSIISPHNVQTQKLIVE